MQDCQSWIIASLIMEEVCIQLTDTPNMGL